MSGISLQWYDRISISFKMHSIAREINRLQFKIGDATRIDIQGGGGMILYYNYKNCNKKKITMYNNLYVDIKFFKKKIRAGDGTTHKQSLLGLHHRRVESLENSDIQFILSSRL